MTKQEFLKRLGDLLACLPADQVREAQAFYAEAIDDRMEDGVPEEDAVASMGTPGEVAEAILDDLPPVPRAVAKTRRKSNVLLWALVIVGSPVWLALGAAFAITVAAIYATIWILAASVWIVALAFAAIGPVCWVLAFDGALIGHIAFAVAFLGIGLSMLGVGLLLGAAAFAATKSLAHVSVMWLRKAFSPFTKGRKGTGNDGSTRDGSHLLVEIRP
ncbi:HAAS domain-containing protein [uncultured Enorma sp.]|uniref:DUF1700 domain-containing protein n=1 Tax=uncultured Enorma sp. TaxID=1714346 RepID=UPI0028054D31|nr:DUF1700 domain-containing protein [uncultured Enorma sp.]